MLLSVYYGILTTFRNLRLTNNTPSLSLSALFARRLYNWRARPARPAAERDVCVELGEVVGARRIGEQPDDLRPDIHRQGARQRRIAVGSAKVTERRLLGVECLDMLGNVASVLATIFTMPHEKRLERL